MEPPNRSFPRGLCRPTLSWLVLLLATLVCRNAAGPTPVDAVAGSDVLQAVGMEPVPDSLQVHNLTQPREGFAVRIAVPFLVAITLNQPAPPTVVFRLGLHLDDPSIMEVPIVGCNGTVCVVGVEVPLEATPGKYDNVCVFVGNATNRGIEYHYPFLLKLVDYDSHQPGIKILRVHVMRDYFFDQHGTADYHVPLGFAIRRGQSFQFRVSVSKRLRGPYSFYLNCKSQRAVRLRASRATRKGERYTFVVTTNRDAPIGKYTDLVVGVRFEAKDSSGKVREQSAEFLYPWPMYVVFNAYDPKEVIHLPDKAARKQYLEDEHGMVFDGPLGNYEIIPWYYGHYSQDSLDAAFFLIRNCTHDFTDVRRVVQCVAARIMWRPENPEGIIEPRWPPFFLDGVDPDEWSSVDGIIRQWLQTNHTAVKYGQCWIIAALTCTLLRTLGIPTRQIVAFGAIQDDSDVLDPAHVPHHVVVNYYLRNGRLVTSVGHVWRFHSWVDIWMRRDDLPHRYSGWQAVDATVRNGQGQGPASVRAIYEARYDLPYNVTTFVSGLHSSVRDVLVECDDELPVAPRIGLLDVEAHCRPKRTLKVQQNAVPLVATCDVGAYRLLDITHQYVNPHLPTEIPGIPFLPDPLHPTNSSLSATLKSHLVTTAHKVEVEAHVVIAEAILQPAEIDVSVVAELGCRSGHRELRRKSTAVRLHPRASCTAEVDFRLVLPDLRRSDPKCLEVRVVAVERHSGAAAIAKHRHRLP
eukprot:EG_transcript_4455